MTHSRPYIPRKATLFLLIFSLFLCGFSQPAMAKKKDKKKVKTEQTDYYFLEPDPVSTKSKPDRRPRNVEQPLLEGGGRYYGPHIHGIDVSHYQGNIDWGQVARDRDVNYVFIKASEGGNITDEYYTSNVREARRKGLKVGSYHFFRANVAADVQFRNFMSKVEVRHQDLLPIIDVETTNGVPSATFHARLQELLRLVTREFGKRPIIYTGKNFYNKHFYGGRYRDYKFMIACYTPDNEPVLFGNDDYVLWQYSQTGRIRGIRGSVDRSRLVGRHGMRDILLR